MILSYGQEEYIDNKKRLIRYNFFKDEQHGGRDAIFGLDIPLMRLVSVLHSAAQRYGTERRVILLHGPVGSSKSTIARLIKRGMEEYSRTPEGALYTFEWTLPEKLTHVTGGQQDLQVPDARGAVAADSAGVARSRADRSRLERGGQATRTSKAIWTPPAGSSSASCWPSTKATGRR